MSGAGGPGPEAYFPKGTPGIDPRVPLPPSGDRRSRMLGGDGARSVWIAVASTVIFFAAVIVAVVSSPGWSAPGGFKRAFFNGEIFADSLPKILDGFLVNVRIFVIAEVLVLAFALLLAVMRSLPGPVFAPLRLLAVSYTILFRGLPTILVIFVLGFGMPALELQGLPNSDLFWAIVALTLVYSAYVAEVYRAGIESVHPSQTAAARSLGLRRGQAMRYVVLPQAVKRVLPPLAERFHRPAEGLRAGRGTRASPRVCVRPRSRRPAPSTSRRSCRWPWSTWSSRSRRCCSLTG